MSKSVFLPSCFFLCGIYTLLFDRNLSFVSYFMSLLSPLYSFPAGYPFHVSHMSLVVAISFPAHQVSCFLSVLLSSRCRHYPRFLPAWRTSSPSAQVAFDFERPHGTLRIIYCHHHHCMYHTQLYHLSRNTTRC
ncbi:hypothetical protein F5880DRAFT_818876 [Lentinula raphanica]|nr:hypothetical protein F5880DRAFT_818876 [Lentinula raphanica]